MKIRPKEPAVPADAHETLRRQLFSLLLEGQHTAKELSSAIGISEKEVYDHLEHIRRSGSRAEQQLRITPAKCRKCGFAFTKRERLRKPGKCPVCRGETIQQPAFSVE